VKLRARWTLALLFTGAVPLAALAVSALRIQRDGIFAAEQELEAAASGRIASIVDGTIQEAATTTHRVGTLLTDGRIDSDEARLDLARETLAQSSALGQVAVYDGEGKLLDAIVQNGAVAPKPPDTLPASAATIDGGGGWLPVELVGGRPLLRYAEPFFGKDGGKKPRAWLLGYLRTDGLSASVGEIAERELGRRDTLVVVDTSGRVVASGVESGTLAPGGSLAGKELFAKNDLGPIAKAVPKIALVQAFDAENGERMVGTVRPLRTWLVVVRRPYAIVFAHLAATQRLTILYTVGFLALVAAIGAFLAGRTIQPIRALGALAAAYGRREFLTPSPVHTNDELEQLGSTLTRMAADIASGEIELSRRAAIEQDLSRFMPETVAKAIASGEKDLALGGQRRSITVLFADVVSFTPFAEAASPEQVVAFLNELFTVLTEVVFRHRGTVDKFMGDCLMAIFGAPEDQPEHAVAALSAAEDMHRFVEASAPGWKEKYGIECRLAIGVSTGEALVGNLGSEARMEYTAIGDAVNVAARLEALARPGQTLVTADTMAAAGDAFGYATLGEHPLRGKKQLVTIAEVR